jgi:hypothetical protein
MAAPLDPRKPLQDGSQDPEALEQLIGEVLSQQPTRRAPRTLQARVLQELERREALPWWRHSFLHWPLPVRALFILALLGVVKLVLSGFVGLSSEVRSSPVVETIAKPFSWAEASAAWLSKMVNYASLIFDAIPSHWLYAGIALAAVLYVALLLLGATAYRTLYVNK